MKPSGGTDLERLSSSSTTWWSRYFPATWSAGFAAFVAAAWLDLLGSSPLPDLAKGAFLAIWVVISVFLFRWLGGYRHVWLDGQELVVGDPRRGVRIPLGDVVEVRETRFSQLKTAELVLRHRTPLGTTVRFMPEDGWRWMFPWAASPTLRDLRERVASLESAETPRELSR